jgi:hypothetical protein
MIKYFISAFLCVAGCGAQDKYEDKLTTEQMASAVSYSIFQKAKSDHANLFYNDFPNKDDRKS